MIKFTGSGDNGKIIGIGLSRANCERLLEHKPISINLQSELNIPFKGKIIILADETEAALTKSLRDLITEDTVLHIDDRAMEEAMPVMTPSGAREVSADLMLAQNEKYGRIILVDLKAPYTRFGMSAGQARAFGKALIEKADQLDSQKPTIGA